LQETAAYNPQPTTYNSKKFFDILEEVIEKKRRQQIGSCLALKVTS
jgi:hypothetical protein